MWCVCVGFGVEVNKLPYGAEIWVIIGTIPNSMYYARMLLLLLNSITIIGLMVLVKSGRSISSVGVGLVLFRFIRVIRVTTVIIENINIFCKHRLNSNLTAESDSSSLVTLDFTIQSSKSVQ